MTTPALARRERLADLGEAMIAAYGRVCADENMLFGLAARLAGAVDSVRCGRVLAADDLDLMIADARGMGLLSGSEAGDG